MNRYSVLYLINEQYHHIGCATYTKAQSLLQTLLTDARRRPVGIYDDKTELFDWEGNQQQRHNQADLQEQSRQHAQIVTIAQALRRRDASWHPAVGFQRPSFFA